MDLSKDFVALNTLVNDDITKENFSAERLKSLMQMYNDWQTDAKITAPESEASSS